MNRDQVTKWLESYVAAWQTYDRARIAALFSEDVSYRYHPHDDPVVGRDAIVESWLEEPDAAGTYEARYEPVAVDGNVVVAVGSSTYRPEDGSVEEIYDNCFVMRFDGESRCTDFTEWFMKRPG
jgi:ketosteroid isomerase-like protein